MSAGQEQKLPRTGWRRWMRVPHVSLAGFMVVSVVLAIILVGIGHILYVTSSGYKLDVTRPGLKEIPKDEFVEVNGSQTYDSTSPVDRGAVEEEVRSMNTRLGELDRYGDFADDALSRLQDELFDSSAGTEQVQ